MTRTLRITTTLTAMAFCMVLVAATARADGWQPVLTSHEYAPETILAIDKKSQTFFMLRHHSPLRMERSFPCTTGQAEGDKQIQGDLRTPEGVYFIGYRIDRRLDWDLYGDVAYSLNYPNPIDRMKGKTGSGIWLHGRGKELVPMDTRGCVALKVPDISSMNNDIASGTPVVIGEKVSWADDSDDTRLTARMLVEELKNWAHHWERKADAFFDYYAPDKITRSEGSPFSGFVSHKKSVFASQPWIQVLVDNVHTIKGPDYWVTWFDQYYRAPSLTSQVGKRFYWQKDEDGRFRIVGREYTPASEDLSGTYLEAKSTEVQQFITSWAESWRDADISRYVAYYAENAKQDNRTGLDDIAEYKRELWAEKPPVKVDVGKPSVELHPLGLKATFSQQYKDSTGYSDTGTKTLILTPAGEGWSITNEIWRRTS